MKKHHTILIADRNPNVRSFFRREMAAEGYRVRLAENAREVVDRALRRGLLNLVILDPDLPGMHEYRALEILQERHPSIPMIVHTFSSVYADFPPGLPHIFIEKQAASIEQIKEAVARMLDRDPSRP